MTEAWEGLIIGIGYELEMKTKDDNYPIDYHDLLDRLHSLEEQIRGLLLSSKPHSLKKLESLPNTDYTP